MNYELTKANIVDIAADALVLPANEALLEGSGTSEAIFKAAGRKKLTQACREIGHCDMGYAVPTPAYKLDARCIIHAVVPRWIDGDHHEYDLLSSAYFASLQLADLLECESIAFPLLASGNNGFDKELAVRIATESIAAYKGEHLKKVYLVIFSDTLELFLRTLGFKFIPAPKTLHAKDREKHIGNWKRILHDGKEAVLNAFEEQASNVIKFIQDPKNQKMLFDKGVQIVMKVMK